MINKTIYGDCRDTMRQWATEGIKAQTCITSPPYWNLRDYHVQGQLGLEPTPEEYIANLVDVFNCVWDVLRDDGTLWIVIGDSYNGSCKGRLANGLRGENRGLNTAGSVSGQPKRTMASDLQRGEMVGIPWMLAFALRRAGWFLVQEIIWHKTNPMPFSGKNRCGAAHETIFLLSKSGKYYFDADAIRERARKSTISRLKRGVGLKNKMSDGVGGQKKHGIHRQRSNNPDRKVSNTRAKRSVWTCATAHYPGAHHATYPPKLIKPCVLAGSPPGGIVLDPFMGSGTTAMVALQNGRRFLGCELNPDNEDLQTERLAGIQPTLF